MPIVVELEQLGLVDGSDTELALHCGDQGRPLEQSTAESFEGTGKLGLSAGQLVVETNDTNIFLSSALLGLDESGGSVNADDQASCDFWIESTTVTSLLHPEHALDPCYDFVARGIRGLVEINHTR